MLREKTVPPLRTIPLVSPVLWDYLALTKPTIVSLLLVTALGGMFLAEQGIPSATLMMWVLIGGSLGAGGANALNHYIERDRDILMHRTRHRPVAEHRIRPGIALVFGLSLNGLAFLVFGIWVNWLSAGLTLGAALFYVMVYTIWLKPSTAQNIVIGGAAGAVPPLVGWAAVTGTLGLPAFYLFAIVFFWTPPHFWALSLLIRKDYARAGIPMLPVVRGVKETTWNIFLYSVLLLALSLIFYTTRAVEEVYLIGATALGTCLSFVAWRLWCDPSAANARKTYLYSLFYLAGLFAVIMLDSSISL